MIKECQLEEWLVFLLEKDHRKKNKRLLGRFHLGHPLSFGRKKEIETCCRREERKERREILGFSEHLRNRV